MNVNVLITAIKANLFLIVLVDIIVYILFNKSNKSFSISNILIKNAIILVFIGLTEFSFLQFFGSKYISLNPNVVKHTIIHNIKDLVKDLKIN